MSKTIGGMKLITGEDIIGEVIETNEANKCRLKNPVSLAVVRGHDGQPTIGMAPFPMHTEVTIGRGKDSEITVDKQHIVYQYTPAQEYINNYNQIFSGIITPEKKVLLG